MNTLKLDGRQLKLMLIGGAQSIKDSCSYINDLNVFPVPDGDTGTNMLKTLEGGLAEISSDNSVSIGAVMEKFAHGMLLGARGNSGVILSQIFAGIADGLKGLESATAEELARAYKAGIERSYSAVQNPTEGTILTVFRESTQYASNIVGAKSCIEELFKLHIEEAERSLARTKELLDVLAEADVVDSGAAGYLCIVTGMYAALTGEKITDTYSFDGAREKSNINIDSFTADSVLEFGYCTELLLRLMNSKVDTASFDEQVIVNELCALGGESIVAFKTGDIVKIHVHTFTPGEVFSVCQKYGEFLTVKVENMSLSHTDEVKEKPKKKAVKPYSVVAVATGEGICSLLCQLGVDEIVSGGQSANPSAEEFIEAFNKCEGENILVFPNNKNVFLAASQAADMWCADRVHIIHTANISQCYGALSVLTPGITDINALVAGAERAASDVVGGEVTYAVRDALIDGIDIKKGEYIAICGGKIRANAESAEDALCAMIASVEDIDDKEILTLFVGCDVSEDERVALTDRLEDEYPDFEITVYEGGQELYSYIVAIE